MIIGCVIAQGFDIGIELGFVHAGEMDMFDGFEFAAKEFDAKAKFIQTKIGGLDEDDDVAGFQMVEAISDIAGCYASKIDKGAARQGLAIGFGHDAREGSFGIKNDERILGVFEFDGISQNVLEVFCGSGDLLFHI